jgi:predicted nuclease of predicted toxin-antitoxin system
LKKPSGGTSKQLDDWTFLVEVSLGKRVAATLRESGLRVVAHNEVLAPDVSDTDWIQAAAKANWVVLTKDGEIQRKPNEVGAIMRSGLRVFVLSRGNWTAEEMAKAFILAATGMRKVLIAYDGAFIARITKSGGVSTILSARSTRRRI